MKRFGLLTVIALAIFAGCGGSDPIAEIDAMVNEGKVAQAKMKYKELVEIRGDVTTRRDYIRFLKENNQLIDFRREVKAYLVAFPDDAEIKNLEYDHYARLATDAEKADQYQTAMDYILNKLLQSDNPDYRKWESRQTTVLKKWYKYGEEQSDENVQRNALLVMKNLGFDNLATSLAPELYQKISEEEQQAASQDQTEQTPSEPAPTEPEGGDQGDQGDQ